MGPHIAQQSTIVANSFAIIPMVLNSSDHGHWSQYFPKMAQHPHAPEASV